MGFQKKSPEFFLYPETVEIHNWRIRKHLRSLRIVGSFFNNMQGKVQDQIRFDKIQIVCAAIEAEDR